MKNRFLVFIILFASCVQYGFSQNVEIEGDTTELKMVDTIGHKRVLLFVKGNKSGLTAYTPTGLSVAQLVTSGDGFSGRLILENDSQVASIAAHGGSESGGTIPNIKIKGKSTKITMNEEGNTERVKLSIDDDKAGLVISNPMGNSVAELMTASDGKSGKLVLDNDNQIATVLIEGGSMTEGSMPSVIIQGDSSKIVLNESGNKERIRLFVSEDKSGFVASDPEGKSVAQLITTTNGKSGILALDNESQVATIFAQGGSASTGAIPLIRIKGDSTVLEMKNSNNIERTRLFIKEDKSGIVVSNLEGKSVAQMITTPNGLSGLLALDNDSQKATIFAQGGSSSLGLNPMIRITGDSSTLLMNNNNDIERSKLFISDEESGLSVSDLAGNPIAEIKTTEDGNSGMLSLKDDFQRTTILVEGGSDELNTDPLIQMKGDFTKLTMDQENEFERLRLFVDDLKSGVVVSNSEGESVAQMITSEDGDFGIFGLDNDAQTPTVLAIGGSISGSINPEIRISAENTASQLSLQMNADNPILSMSDASGDELLKLSTGFDHTYGELFLKGENGEPNIVSGTLSTSSNHGFFSIYNDLGHAKVDALATPQGNGIIHLWGANGNSNILLSDTGDPNRPYLHLADTAGVGKAGGYIGSDEKGALFADQYILKGSNTGESTIFIDGSGNSVIRVHTVDATVKSFRIAHPSQPDKEIWYASIEGPEAAAYVRGTGTLSNGKAIIHLPSYFSEIVELQGMTVLLTPLSGKSKGMAVIKKDVGQFSVVELLEGNGSYQFDWEVKGIRSGLEDFQVIRERPKRLKSNIQDMLSKSNEKQKAIYKQKGN